MHLEAAQVRDGFEWIRNHHSVVGWLATVSVLMFVFSLILVPWVAACIPQDYFAHKQRPRSPWADQHFVIRAIMLTAKNALGMLLLITGFAMLVLPGQGLMSMVAGIMLMDFPGKFRLERWLVSRRAVLRSINWLRKRTNRGPLIVDESFD